MQLYRVRRDFTNNQQPCVPGLGSGHQSAFVVRQFLQPGLSYLENNFLEKSNIQRVFEQKEILQISRSLIFLKKKFFQVFQNQCVDLCDVSKNSSTICAFYFDDRMTEENETRKSNR